MKSTFLRITHESLYRGPIFRNHDNRNESPISLWIMKSNSWLLEINIFDGIVKSRHSRETCPQRYPSGNGNPENSNYMKISREERDLRRNDKKYPSQTFYETIIFKGSRRRHAGSLPVRFLFAVPFSLFLINT